MRLCVTGRGRGVRRTPTRRTLSAGSAIAGAVAARVAGSYRTACALTIGAVDVTLIAMNAVSIPHPIWMLAAGLLLPIPLAWLAARQVQKGLASTR